MTCTPAVCDPSLAMSSLPAPPLAKCKRYRSPGVFIPSSLFRATASSVHVEYAPYTSRPALSFVCATTNTGSPSSGSRSCAATVTDAISEASTATISSAPSVSPAWIAIGVVPAAVGVTKSHSFTGKLDEVFGVMVMPVVAGTLASR